MIKVKHSVQTNRENNPNVDVSANAWNDYHSVLSSMIVIDLAETTRAGTTTFYQLGGYIQTNNSTSYAYVREDDAGISNSPPKILFDKNPVLECYFYLAGTTFQSSARVYITVGTKAGTDPESGSYLDKCFGVKIWYSNGIQIGIISSDGSARSVTLPLASLSLGVLYRLTLKYISGSKIELYLNGVKVGEKTNDLPSGNYSSTDSATFQIYATSTTAGPLYLGIRHNPIITYDKL